MKASEIEIIEKLVGSFTDSQLQNLMENIDYYIHPKICVFVPRYKYCDYAVSPNHTHPGYSFIYNIAINGDLLVEGEKVNSMVPLPNICAFSPNIKHQEVLREGLSHYYAIVIEADFFESICSKYGLGRPVLKGVFFQNHDDIFLHLKSLLYEMEHCLPNQDDIVESQIKILVHKLVRLCIPSANIEEVSFVLKNQVDVAVNFLYENISNKITVDEMAESVNMSVSHFSRTFKNCMKKTPVEYLSEIRIEKSKRLLKYSSLNLSEIAFECGFGSLSYFSRCFQESIGQTPSEYKRCFTLQRNQA